MKIPNVDELYDFKGIQSREDQYIRDRRRAMLAHEQKPSLEVVTDPPAVVDAVGMALGGGGVRSATFNLGVLQGLARCGVLRFIDYLSTVSGGGYIGCSWLWCSTHPDDPQRLYDFPFGRERTVGDAATRRVDWIRAHGRTMTPGRGLNGWAFGGSILMGSLLSLIIAIPTALLLIATLLFPLPNPLPPNALPIFKFLFWPLTLALGQTTGFHWLLTLGYDWLLAAFFVFMLGPVPTSLFAGLMRMATFRRSRRMFVWLGRSLMIGCMVMAVGCIPFIMPALSIFTDWVLSLASGLTTIGVGSMAFAHRFFKGKTAQGLGAFVMRAGLILAVIGLFVLLHAAASALIDQMAAPPGSEMHLLLVWLGIAVMLAVGICLLPFFTRNLRWLEQFIGLLLVIDVAWAFWHVAGLPDRQAGLLLALGVLFVSVVLGFFANINHVSMHRYYRNALLEAYFVPSDRETAVGSTAGDSYPLAALATGQNGPSPLPYLLMNSAMHTVGSKNHKLRERGADNFLFSPLHCGARSTDFRPTEKYEGGAIKLATAMAISGAALHPNSYATRSRPMAFLLSLFNIRLGYWIGNPRYTRWRLSTIGRFLSGDLVSEMTGFSIDECGGRLMLADGGHLKNLGLYELFARRCKYIIVCEAPSDRECRFGDFVQALERAQVDLGVRVDIDLSGFVPHPVQSPPFSLPRAPSAFTFGKIFYAHNEGDARGTTEHDGCLLYLRAALIRDLPEIVDEYAAKHAAFPYDVIVDQFFDERQFEAYRELGYCIARSLCHARSLSGHKQSTNIRQLFPDEFLPG